MAPCFCNFNSGTLESGKPRVATSKTTTVWFLASNLTGVPLDMKCQVNSEKSQIFPNTRPTWFLLGKLVATYNFATSLFCTTQSPLAVPKLYIIPRQCLCCRDLGSFASNDKHGLEEQWCHLARLTSRVEPFRMARLGWFPRWAKVQLYGFWHRTGLVCHWPWDVKSTIRKAVLPKHNTKLDCIRKTGGYLQLRNFTILRYTVSTKNQFSRWHLVSSSPKVVYNS